MKKFLLNLLLRARVLKAATLSAVGHPIGDVTPVGRLSLVHRRANGEVVDHGLVSTKMVTTTGVNFVANCFYVGGNTIGNLKFHASGTGVVAPAITDTALGTEVATRATGTQAVGASSNIYHTVGTVSYSGSFAITEWGLFSASSVGTCFDRATFAAINVASGDSIDFTFDLTLPAGS